MKLKITVICSVVFSLFFFLLLFLVIFFADDTDSGENNKDSSIPQGGVTVSPEVLAHRPLIEKYGKEYGIEDYVSYILAIMQVESGGTKFRIFGFTAQQFEYRRVHQTRG